MRAIIISIGDELILGQVVDTNAAWISERLVEQGIVPEYHQAVPDNLEAIAETIKLAAAKADLVIVSGGLGPTPDDLTRQAMAAAAGVKMVLHRPSLKKLKAFFRKRGKNMSDNNRVQAMFPKGAIVLDNPIGTAPGFSIVFGKAKVVVMPGVPKEMKLMFERHIVPMFTTRNAWLTIKNRSKVMTMKINVFGLGESLVAEKLGKLMWRDRNPLVGTTVSDGIISVRIRGEFTYRNFKDAAGPEAHALPTGFSDQEKVGRGVPAAPSNSISGKNGAREPALPEMRKTAEKIKRLLGDVVFSEGDVSLAEVVGKMLRSARKTVVTAESCTAGLLAAMLTETPGSSAYFLGGWVVYSNKMKTENLAVPDELIRREGAVSEPVARKMAEEALELSNADYALALTGIAGPSGGSHQKPVGTVWIALAQKKGGGIETYAERFLFPGDRASVRERAAKSALNILRLCLMRTKI